MLIWLEEMKMSRQTIAKRTIAERIAERLNLGQTVTLQVIQSFLDEVVDELDGESMENWKEDDWE